jgi:outer membrane protein TolC
MAALLFDDYYLVERALEINEEHIRLLDGFRSVAAARYAAGLAPQQAPIQAEVEAAHLLHRRIVLAKERRAAVARLNALLHRDPRASLPSPAADLESAAHELEPTAALEEAALARRPEVLELRAETEARRQAVALEELAFRPSFDFVTSYNSMWDMPEHRWMVSVGVNVPLRRGRIRAAVAEARARLEANQSEIERLTDEVRAEVEIALAGLDESAHEIALYRDRVLPAARDGIAAARAGFETGAASMLDLIDAERSLRTALLNYEEALAEHASRRTELDRALGRLPLVAGGFAGPGGVARPTRNEEMHHGTQ